MLVASDEKNDLALVRLKSISNPVPSVAVFREGAAVRPGDPIVALGYPLSGLLSSDANLSVGNVSALAGLRDDSSLPANKRACATRQQWRASAGRKRALGRHRESQT